MESRKGKSQQPFQQFVKLAKPLIVGGVIIACVCLLNVSTISRLFPIKTVHVYGVNRLNQHELQEALTPLLDHGFFATKIELIRDRLRDFIWVSDISVRRTWPDMVDVMIVEKNAVARWQNSGLLSDNGEVFTPELSTYPDNLPEFNGPPGKQIIMLEHFKNINRILVPLHAKIAYLELTPYEAWKLTLDNGITLQMGNKDILTRLSHFVKVYSKIIGNRVADVDYVDLRYPNGVAVKLKSSNAKNSA